MTPCLFDCVSLILGLLSVWLLYWLGANQLLTLTQKVRKGRLIEDLTDAKPGEEHDFWRLRAKYPTLPLSVYTSCINDLQGQGVLIRLLRVNRGNVVIDCQSVSELPENTDLEDLSVVVRRI